MEAPIRKRVTRVGSGAYSIYLPKKWIDSWNPAQQEDRQVDLHRINDALLVVPVIQEQSLHRHVDVDEQTVVGCLMSSYVRGFEEVSFTPRKGTFDTQTQLRCRDVLRHTDERIVTHVGPDKIGFRLDPSLPPPFTSGADLLGVLGAKLREMLRLAGESVDAYPDDPERALHAMHMLASVHDEDVERLWHQALRLVARIELPLETVSDFQVLDLVASEMHTASAQAIQIAQIILEEAGLALEDLEYPRAHLMGRREHLPRMPAVARGILRAYRASFEDMQTGIQATLGAISKRDMGVLHATGTSMRRAQDALQDRIIDNAVAFWGQEEPVGPQRAATASRIAQPIAQILDSIERLCQRARLLLASAPGEVPP